ASRGRRTRGSRRRPAARARCARRSMRAPRGARRTHAARPRRGRFGRACRACLTLRSPWLGLLYGVQVVALLVDAEALILIQEVAPQQPARILPNPAQPLLGRLIRRPTLELLGIHRNSIRSVRELRLRRGLRLALLRLAVDALAFAGRRRRVCEPLAARVVLGR